MLFNRVILCLICGLLFSPATFGQRSFWRTPSLPRDRSKSGQEMLEAFSPIGRAVRDSVVSIEVDGNTVALGTVVDSDGMILTKASEIPDGKLTCTLADGRVVEAAIAATEDEDDLALLQVDATGLRPIEWAQDEPIMGQWAITPGIQPAPEALGIVSASPRRIQHKRALIGVMPDFSAAEARVRQVLPGLGAANAGVKAGDVILAVNETPISNGEELVQTLRSFREGQTVKLRVRRDTEELELSVPMRSEDAVTLGRGLARQERMNRLGGELSRRAEGFPVAFQHDSVLKPSQCGGPLVNLAGKAIGLNIARAGRIASYALPAAYVEEAVARLKLKVKAK